jgi:hypothetical protein
MAKGKAPSAYAAPRGRQPDCQPRAQPGDPRPATTPPKLPARSATGSDIEGCGYGKPVGCRPRRPSSAYGWPGWRASARSTPHPNNGVAATSPAVAAATSSAARDGKASQVLLFIDLAHTPSTRSISAGDTSRSTTTLYCPPHRHRMHRVHPATAEGALRRCWPHGGRATPVSPVPDGMDPTVETPGQGPREGCT